MSIETKREQITSNNNIIAENTQKVFSAGQKSMIDESKIIPMTASGMDIVRVDDISEVPHDIVLTTSNPDYGGITVYGKNLFDPQLLLNNGYTQLEDGSYQGTSARAFCIYSRNLDSQQENRVFTISYIAKNMAARTKSAFGFLIKYVDGFQEYKAELNRTIVEYTYIFASTHPEKTVAEIWISYNVKGEINIKNIQLEYGTSATNIVPYINPIDFNWPNDNQIVIKNFNSTITIELPYDQTITVAYNKSYGVQKKLDEFWDNYQQYGLRANQSYLFSNNFWNDIQFKPKYNIVPNAADHMFYQSRITTNGLQNAINNGIVFDFSKSTNLAYAFASMSMVTEIPFDISLDSVASNKPTTGMCGWNTNLKKIKKVILKQDGTSPLASTSFTSCPNLESIEFEGTIGQSINFSSSTKLNPESLKNIFSALKKHTSTDVQQTLTISGASETQIKSTTAGMNLFNEACATLDDGGKGWSISIV